MKEFIIAATNVITRFHEKINLKNILNQNMKEFIIAAISVIINQV